MSFFTLVISWYVMLGMTASYIIFYSIVVYHWVVGVLFYNLDSGYHRSPLVLLDANLLMLITAFTLTALSFRTIKRNGGFRRRYFAVTGVAGGACFAALLFWP